MVHALRTLRLCGYVEKTPISSNKSKKKPIASRHLSRRKRNQWHQESAEKTLNSKKKPMASRIRREDTQQQEETNGVKNPLRRHSTARRNQWHQESAEKTMKKKTMESRHPLRRNPAQERK